jgi:MFS family permease
VTSSPRKPAPLARFSHIWRALRHRNFRLFFVGQGTSVIGSWMTRLATSWLVYRLTHSALLLGVVGFSGQIVPFLLGPVAGAWIEPLDRRRLLVWTQAAAAVQSLALAALTLSGRITFWEIIALSAFQGLINAFDAPARHAFLVQMVEDREDLSNAIALNSSMVNGGRLIGPAIAGLVIAATNEGWCFLIDGISYLAVIASLLMMHVRPLTLRARANGVAANMREGWRYVRSSPALSTVLVLMAVISLMGFPYMVLMPVFAAQTLHGGPNTLGWLTGASGIGSLASALSLAARRTAHGLTRMLPIAAAILGAALILFGLSHTLWLSLLLMLFCGFGLMQVAAAVNTILQSLVTDDKRARVMSYYTMAFFGGAPFGSLLAGYIAHRFGAARAVEVTGTCCLLAALWFLSRLSRVDAAANQTYHDAEAAQTSPATH